MGYRNYIKNLSVYEVTVQSNFVNGGPGSLKAIKTANMLGSEVVKLFGRHEANEALNGYSPNITIFKL